MEHGLERVALSLRGERRSAAGETQPNGTREVELIKGAPMSQQVEDGLSTRYSNASPAWQKASECVRQRDGRWIPPPHVVSLLQCGRGSGHHNAPATASARRCFMAAAANEDHVREVKLSLEICPVRVVPELDRHRAGSVCDHAVVGNDGIAMDFIGPQSVHGRGGASRVACHAGPDDA